MKAAAPIAIQRVDTPFAGMKTVDELYTEAEATISQLNADAKASAELLADAQARIATLTAEKNTLTAQIEALNKEIREHKTTILVANYKIGRLEAEAPKEDDLLVQFKAITDPGAQTIFWRSLSAMQQNKLQSLLK